MKHFTFKPIQWDLYWHSPDTIPFAKVNRVNNALNKGLERLLHEAFEKFGLGELKEAGKYVRDGFNILQEKYRAFGAWDTEPDVQIYEQINEYIPGAMESRWG